MFVQNTFKKEEHSSSTELNRPMQASELLRCKRLRRGFTVIEVVVAVGVVGILLAGVLSVITPAQIAITNTLEKKRLVKLATAVESEFSVLRTSDTALWTTAFDKALYAIATSDDVTDPDSLWIAAEYYSDKTLDNDTGRMASTERIEGGQFGDDYIIVPLVTKTEVDGTDIAVDYLSGARGSGRLYFVRFVQLVNDVDGNLVETPEIGELVNVDPTVDNSSGTAVITYDPVASDQLDLYTAAWVGMRIEFYPANTSDINAALSSIIAGTEPWTPTEEGKPVFTYNIIVRR